MSIETKHPDYLSVSPDWVIMRVTFAGERAVKDHSFTYLPPTSSQVADGAATGADNSTGWQAYNAYITRSKFPEFVDEAIEKLVGVMVREDAIIDLPPQMEPMRDNATRKGESLQAFLRRIFEQQMLFGRFGVLADAPQFVDPARGELPHLVEYQAETIINWDDDRLNEFQRDKLNFLVVDETTHVRGMAGEDMFAFQQEQRFRVAFLEPIDETQPASVGNPLVYKTWAERDDVRTDVIIPTFMGATLDRIPFVFIGSNDMNSTPDEIPLLKLANQALHVYRKSADHEQALFMQGQDTLVIIGDETDKDGNTIEGDTRVGAGAKIKLAADENSSASFIGVESKGLGEMRASRDAAEERGMEMGARLLEARKGQAESGEALTIRVAAATASLSTIAITGAAGLQKILRDVAEWMGLDPETVKVVPNLDFTQEAAQPRTLEDMVKAKAAGFPISNESMHQWSQDRNFTSKTFDEELAAIDSEETLIPEPLAPVAPNPDDDPEDE